MYTFNDLRTMTNLVTTFHLMNDDVRKGAGMTRVRDFTLRGIGITLSVSPTFDESVYIYRTDDTDSMLAVYDENMLNNALETLLD